MSEYEIRPYAPQDLDRVLEIWEEASRTGHPFLAESLIVAERERVRDLYLPMAATWVCEEDGRACGFMSLIDDEIGALFVDPSRHRRGIGGALMDFAMSLHSSLELEVFKENSGARRFYEGFGFLEVAELVHPETGRLMLRLRHDPQAGGVDGLDRQPTS